MNDLPKSFTEELENMNEDQCAEIIVESTKKICEIEKEMDEDHQLTQAKSLVKDLSGGYKSAIKYEKKKIKAALGQLREIQEGLVNPSSGANK